MAQKLVSFASRTWDLAPTLNTIGALPFTDTLAGWERARKLTTLPPVGLDSGTLASWIIWNLWIARNQLIFQKRTSTPEETISKAISDARVDAYTDASSPTQNETFDHSRTKP